MEGVTAADQSFLLLIELSAIVMSKLTWRKVLPEFQNISHRVFRIYIHGVITVGILMTITHFMFLLLTTKEDFMRDKVLKQAYENKWFLLSIWVSVVEILYFGIYSVIDLIAICGKNEERNVRIKKLLYEIANYIYFSIVFPLSILVVITFWSLYHWDTERMYPEIVDRIFPRYLNHIIHTCPLPITFLYMFTDVRSKPPKYKTLPALFTFVMFYTMILLETRRANGHWGYPALDYLSSKEIEWLLVFTNVGSLILFFLGYYLHDVVKDLALFRPLQLLTTN